MRRWGLLAVGLMVTGVAWGQTPPVLHEYVAPPKTGGSTPRVMDPQARTDPGQDPSQTDPTTNPPAIRQQGKLIVEPPKSPTQSPGEPIFNPDAAPDRETSTRPDYNTRADSTLHYQEVFNPSVVPFKRMSALDAVGREYQLSIYDAAHRDLPVGGDLDPARDLFWGSLLLELRPGEDVPIPSVAPDMRILSYEIAPVAPLTFSKDGADNYYVRSDDRTAKGQFRLVFLVDAPASYFAPTVPHGYTVSQVAATDMAHALPAAAQRSAEEVLDMLHVSPSTPLDEAVDTLVTYFRGFQAGPSPEATDDIYLDLVRSKTGVCRHRSFAFMVTANAAGIPTRYVTNEAHAFVEVWLPQNGWARINLGGAASELEASNMEDKQMYRPRAEDPFPKPDEYTRSHTNYTQLDHANVKGLSPEQIDQAGKPFDPNADPNGRDPLSTDPVKPQQTGRLPQPSTRADVAAGKAAVTLVVERVDAMAYRGEALTVSGRANKAAAGLRVQVWLAPAGEEGEGARLVGETIVMQDGRWSAAVELPPDLGVGQHEVYAYTPGDATRASTRSE